MVQFVGFYGTIRGFSWYTSGGCKYPSRVFQYNLSGFCRMFSRPVFMHVARSTWLLGIGNTKTIFEGRWLTS